MEWSTIGGLLLAYAGTPLLLAAKDALVDYVHRVRAAAELKRDKLYNVGSVLKHVKKGNVELFGRCRIHSIQTGRIEVRSMDGKLATSWGVREFMALEPIVEVDDA